MNEREDKWAKELRRRLEDYSEPIPNGGWEKLERELSKPTPVLRPYRRIAAVAAIGLIVVVSSLSIYWLSSPVSEYTKTAQTTVIEKLAKQKETTAYTGEVPVSKPQPIIAQHKTPKSFPMTAIVAKVIEQEEITTDSLSEIDNEQPSTEAETQEKRTEERQQAVTPPTHQSYTTNSLASSPLPQKEKRKRDDKWSVGLLMANNTISTENTSIGFARFAALESNSMLTSEPASTFLLTNEVISCAPNEMDAFRKVVYNSLKNEPLTNIKHRMPVTIGVSLRKKLSNQFAIETGLSYTLLASELKSGDQSYYTQEQKLHYMGIPLKGNWMFMNSKYFSLYLSAGGMLEKCIDANIKTHYVMGGKETQDSNNDLEVKPLQWSLSSAIGAQYNATKNIGLYFEPGIVYYFDDGSEIETIRKKKPFNVNLQLGFRLTY